MSISEPVAEDVERAICASVKEYVISRDGYPTDVKTKVFYGRNFGYTLAVVITHDGFTKKYVYETQHSSLHELIKDVVLADRLYKDTHQFGVDYFSHCLKERMNETETKA